jgi:toxin-antitoxin system PIN domain toxin
MLVDANLLLYAVDETATLHLRALDWWTAALNGSRRVALPWLSLAAFMRIATNPRASAHPLTGREAWEHVAAWLDCDTTWVPDPTRRHAEIFGGLVHKYDLRANMITDAQLATLAIEHGLTVYSADTDFARFSELRWVNPVA